MLPLRLLCLAMLITCACIPVQAGIPINPAGRALVDAAIQQQASGNLKGAVDTLVKAADADRTSSLPMHMIAGIMFDAARVANGETKARLSKQAEAAAREALSRNAYDPVAQELLRQLRDEQTPDPLHRPTPAASALLAEGETLFQLKRYSEALAKYEAAASADPQYSVAWVYAGDCFYVQRQWPEAEQRFRKATQIEPLNSQAWRFLADALHQQGKAQDAERAVFAAIAAHPSQLPNWDKLGMYMGASALPLKRLGFMRKANLSFDKGSGKSNLELQAGADGKTVDGEFWLAYGVGLIAAREKQPALSPYAVELEALRTAFQVDQEMSAKGAPALSDPALGTLSKLNAEGKLETAILLLMYRESYRVELERWKVANPNGVPAFVTSYGLRP